MHYLIGDLQGCCDAFERLLAELGFSPSRDRLTVLGDLVNRGPQSLRVLQRLRRLGDAASCLLGNHDLHLLALVFGTRAGHKSDTLREILDAPEREALVDWLRMQHMADEACGWLLVHAGVVPQWDRGQTLALAREVEAVLRGPDLAVFLQGMYGNDPARWHDGLQGAARWRMITNVLTRIRFCSADGSLDFKTKDGAAAAPPGMYAWFDVPGRRTQGTPIAFGHWSTLGLLQRPELLGIDTGCVWGGKLTAVRIDGGRQQITQVACNQAQRPGPA